MVNKEKKQDLKRLETAKDFANYYKNQSVDEKKQLATVVQHNFKKKQQKLKQKNNHYIKNLRVLYRKIQLAEKKLKAVKNIPPVPTDLKKHVEPVLNDFKELDSTTKKLGQKSVELKQTNDVKKKAQLLGEAQQLQEKRDSTLSAIMQFLKDNPGVIYVVLAIIGVPILSPHILNLISGGTKAVDDVFSSLTWFAAKMAIITAAATFSGALIFNLLKKASCSVGVGSFCTVKK